MFRLVQAMIRTYELDVLALEAPIGGHAGGGPPKPHWLVIDMPKLIGAAELAAAVWEECTCGGTLVHKPDCPSPRVMVRQAHVQTVRRHFLGTGRPKNPKEAVKRRCRDLNWPVEDDNAADAAALYCYVKSLACPDWSPKATPLFGKASFDRTARSRFT